MKKNGYCVNCDYEFVYTINNFSDLDNVVCPKCGIIINTKNKKYVPVSKSVRRFDTVVNKVLDFYYYFYFIFSIIGLLGYYFNIEKLLIVSSIISFILYFIELLFGFTRNVFGILGLVICSIIGILVVDSLIIGICVGSCYNFFISGVIKIIINTIINRLYRKYG